MSEMIARRRVHPRVKQVMRGRLSNAVAAGKIQRPHRCEECGAAKKVDAHHDDYHKALDVRWLCRQCHATFHRLTRTLKTDEPLDTSIPPTGTGSRRGPRCKPTDQVRWIMITLKLWPEEHARLKAAAQAHGLTLSAWLRRED
jgi:ribosomal protein S27AE